MGDVLDFFWDIVAFLWRHFFDILEIAFLLAVIAVVVAIAVGGLGAGGALGEWIRARRRPGHGTAAPPYRPTTTAPGRTRGPHGKCHAENNKTIYATQAEADAWVQKTKARFAAEGGMAPLDHSYECPHARHWHVSSKQRY